MKSMQLKHGVHTLNIIISTVKDFATHC